MTEETKAYLTQMVRRSLELYKKLVETGRGDATLEGTIKRFESTMAQLDAGIPLTKNQRKLLRNNVRERIKALTLRIIPEYNDRIEKQPADAARYSEYKKRAEELAEQLRRVVGDLA